MSEDTLSTLNVSKTDNNNATEVVISENETLVALKVADEEALVSKMEELQNILLNNSSSLEEKNKAYDELQDINKKESTKEAITKKIKDTYNLDSFVSIDGNNIKITIASTKHDASLANNIIRSVQELFSDTKYITIKFGN